MSNGADLLGTAAGIFAIIAAGVALRGEKYKTRLTEANNKLESLRKFASTVYFEHYVESDMVVLGPRSHGKTSIVTAITKQWMTVLDTRPTPIDFVLSAWDCPEFEDASFHHEEFGVNMTRRTRARLNVYDYAGEDRAIGSALERIGQSGRCLVAFVVSAEPAPMIPSKAYFNVATLRRIRSSITHGHNTPMAALVLFSKQDTMADHLPTDPTAIPDTLLARHGDELEAIDAIFGETHKFLVSAETGFGLALAMRAILEHVVDVEGMAK